MATTEQADRISYIENEMVELRADIAATNKGVNDLSKVVSELVSVVKVTQAEHQGSRDILKQELAAHREALTRQEQENHERPRQAREAIYWSVGAMLALLGMLGPWVFFTMTKPGEIRDEQHATEIRALKDTIHEMQGRELGNAEKYGRFDARSRESK